MHVRKSVKQIDMQIIRIARNKQLRLLIFSL